MASQSSPLRNPRRILIAAMMFFLLAGSTLGIGFATAADPDVEFAGPVAITQPAIGDRGVYRVSHVDLPAAGASLNGLAEQDPRRAGEWTFEWRPGKTVVTPQGEVRHTHFIAFDDQSEYGDEQAKWDYETSFGILLDRTDLSLVGYVDEWQVHDERDTDDGKVTSVGDSWTVHVDVDNVWGELALCGLASDLQGRTVLGGEVVAGAHACRGGHDETKARGEYRVLGTVMTDGRLMAVVKVDLGFARQGLLWFEDGMPYPSRIEMDRPFWDGGHTLVAELTGFKRSQSPAGVQSPPRDIQPVELVQAPTTPWMFDETGIDHPFPASAAYTIAMERDESGLVEFLDEHPEAYIWDASFWQYDRRDGDDPHVRYEWRLTFRGREAVHGVDVGLRDPPEQTVEEPSPIDRLLGAEPEVTEHDPVYFFETPVRDLEYFGPWMEKPDELPTVASMWDYYLALRQGKAATLEPNYWSWQLLCCGMNDDTRVLIQAGRWQDIPYTDGETYSYAREWAYIEIEYQDSPLPYRYAQRFQVSSLPGEAPPPNHAIQVQALEISAWGLPPGVAVVGAGAGLLAVLYYLWPVLKSGVVGALFSRVQSHDALENPVRRSIHDIIAAEPGVHFQQIARRAGLPVSTAEHHLRKLKQVGLITARRSRGFTSYFIKGAVDHRVMDAMGVLRSPAAKKVLAYIVSNPGAGTNEIADDVGIKAATASYHLGRLREAGLVAKEGRANHPTELAAMAA